MSPGTVYNAARVMKQVLDAAVRARYLRGNPAAGLTRDDFPKLVNKEMLFLTATETAALADAFRQLPQVGRNRKRTGRRKDAPPPAIQTITDERAEAFRLLVLFTVQTGMRAGEVAGLRWENVDLLRGKVTVAESISTLNSDEWYVVPPKNGKTRTVPLDPALVSELREYANRHPDFRPEAYVWPAPAALPTGTNPMQGTNSAMSTGKTPPTGALDATRPMNWGRDFYLPFWGEAVKAAGLNPKLRFHDLRHTCAALLIAANLPAKAIQEHLGHSSYQITMDRYGHLYQEASDAVAAAMGAAFSGNTATPPAPTDNVVPLNAEGWQ